MSTLADTAATRAARARPPRPALLAAAVQQPRLPHLRVSPMPRSDPGMTEADRIDALHSEVAATALVEEDREFARATGDAT